jgi:hypothetical protein
MQRKIEAKNKRKWRKKLDVCKAREKKISM